MFTVEGPTSPLFLILLALFVINLLYAWNGLVRAELPNFRPTILGAQVAGALSLVAMAATLFAYFRFLDHHETSGIAAMVVAIALFVGGLALSERIGH